MIQMFLTYSGSFILLSANLSKPYLLKCMQKKMYLNTTEIKTDSLYRDVVSAWGETKYIGNVASNGPSVPLPHEG
jgi:hypothetical protein